MNNRALELLKNTILEIDLPDNSLINEFDKKEPAFYLCGKSDGGKTSFLNALLNREKGELFTSADISTNTEFSFIFGNEPMYQINNSEKLSLPIQFDERKDLFTELNQEGNKYTIELTEEALIGRTFVDIPGVFDYTNNVEYINEMKIKSDIICYFSPCMSKISAQEYKLLEEFSAAEIPIILLFTMGDITDPDVGITRKTLPEFVQKRIEKELSKINIESHFIVSSDDFYKEKESHGIDSFLKHIQTYNDLYFEKAQNSRLKRLFEFYIKYLDDNIIILEEDAKQVRTLIKRENDLKYEDEKKNIEEENDSVIHTISHKFEMLHKQCKEYILGSFFNYETYKNKNDYNIEKKEAFILMWDNFWKQLKSEYDHNINTPELPSLPLNLFKVINIDNEKIKSLEKKLFGAKNEEDDPKSFMERIKEIQFEDIIKIGINFENAEILYAHWSYFISISNIINFFEEPLIEELNYSLKLEVEELSKKSDIKIKNAIENDNTIEKLEVYRKSQEELKKVKDYA